MHEYVDKLKNGVISKWSPVNASTKSWPPPEICCFKRLLSILKWLLPIIKWLLPVVKWPESKVD
jgi:hypothetical protein